MAGDLRFFVISDRVLQRRALEARSLWGRNEFLHSGCQPTSPFAVPRANKDRSSINLKLLAIQLILCWLAFVSPASAGEFEVCPKLLTPLALRLKCA